MKKFDFIKALAVFAGTIVGAGIFGLPYIALKSGFFIVVGFFIVMCVLAISVHFLLGEVSHDTGRIARIPGYAEEYLGKNAKKFSFFISYLGLTGTLLAYIILGSKFFYLFLNPIFNAPEFVYTLIFFVLGATLIYRGTKTIASSELVIQVIFIILLLVFFTKGFSYINLENLFTFDFKSFGMPYGVVLFSLWGIALVPEIKEMVERDRKKMFAVLSLGVIIAAFCYIFFIFTILSVSGLNTTKDAFSGFAKVIGDKVMIIGILFGLITVFTSFITLGLTLKKILWYDIKLNHNISWVISCFIPLILYFTGIRNFIDVIGLTGAFFLGTESILVILIYRSFIKKRFQRKPNVYIYILILMLIIGMVTETTYFFLR